MNFSLYLLVGLAYLFFQRDMHPKAVRNRFLRMDKELRL